MTNSFAEIIICSTKNELEKLCKSSKITKSSFTDFIVECKAGLTHLNHTMHYIDFVPTELQQQEGDWEVFEGACQNQTSKQRQKAVTRLFKLHGKRQIRVGHMFISKEITHPIREWHFVFFEIKELYDKDSHWVNGSHVHITNHLWPNLYCQTIWENFILRKEFPASKFHLSYRDELRNSL
jgi:hypothetical protein